MNLAPALQYVDAVLDLEYSASEPYSSFVYDSPQHARDIARFLLTQGIGEVANASVALADDGAVLGMIGMLDGAELRSARTAAAVALVRGRKIDPHGTVRDRLRLAADTMIAVEPTDFYLSRIAVSAGSRRAGVARRLMRKLEDAARQRGSARIVLEVSPVHVAACAMYASCGYRVFAEAETIDPSSGRELTYQHLERLL